MVFGTSFELDITRRLEFIFEYQGQWTRSVTASSIHHTEIALDFELTHVLDFEVSLIWDRLSDPQPAADGSRPEPDDIRLVVGLGLEI